MLHVAIMNAQANNANLDPYLKPMVVPGLGSSRLMVPPDDAPPRRPGIPPHSAWSRCSGPTLGGCLPPPPLPDTTAASASWSWGRPWTWPAEAEVEGGRGSIAPALAAALLTRPAPIRIAGRDGEGSSLGKLIRSRREARGATPPTEE